MSVLPLRPRKAEAAGIRVLLAEAEGPVNRLIVEGLSGEREIEVIGIRRPDAHDLGSLLLHSDVIVDTTGAFAPDLLLQAIDAGVRPVSGTVGLSERALSTIDEAARRRGIGAVCASAFCVAEAFMAHMCKAVTQLLEDID